MNIQKGTDYEIYINKYLNEIDQNESWMWKNIPEHHLRKTGLLNDWNKYRIMRKEIKNNENELMDTGCDILLKQLDKYYIVQCKNYSKNSVTVECLGGFFMTLATYDLPGKVYYTSKLSKIILSHKPTERIEYIKKIFPNTIKKIKEEENYSKLIENAYDYQKEAYTKLSEVFKVKNRAILQLPCGLGKTLISMMIGLKYDQVIIVSPLKQYCIQNLERYKRDIKYKDYETLIIDSDGTRDLDYVNNFISTYKKIILSVCFKSCDVLSKILNKLTNYIIIVDEFHNISKNDILGLNEGGIHDILQSNSKILFMSATPRIFDLYGLDDIDDDEGISNDFFGNIEYTYEMGEAIRNKKICDYEIFIPDISINNNSFINDIKKEVDINSLENEVLIKSNFLLRAMLETGARKCILYTRTHIEAKDFKDTIIKINEYFALNIYAETILSTDKINDRNNKLREFTEFDGIGILINVEILNECIDIRVCDSIFMSSLSQVLLKIIQRLCRSNRLDFENIHKIAKIFIWTSDEYNDMLQIISHLKEFDNSFTKEKVNILSLNNNDHQILDRVKEIKKYEVLDNFILEIRKVLTWDQKFDLLIKYFNENNNQIPSTTNKDINIHRLGKWYQYQKYNYSKKLKMMKHQKYYDIWTKFMTEYPEKFLNHDEKWISMLNKVKKFMIDNDNSPSRYSKDTEDNEDIEDTEDIDNLNSTEKEARLGSWLAAQKENYRRCIKIFTHPNIVKIWEDFNIEFKKYLLTHNETWHSRLNELKVYIDTNGKRPSTTSKDEKIKSLGIFISTQNKNYETRSQIMSNNEIYEIWKDFLKTYHDKLLDPDEKWYYSFNLLKEFVEKESRKPNKRSTNQNEKQIGEWFQKQSTKYKNNKMNSNEIKTDYENLLNKYKSIF